MRFDLSFDRKCSFNLSEASLVLLLSTPFLGWFWSFPRPCFRSSPKPFLSWLWGSPDHFWTVFWAGFEAPERNPFFGPALGFSKSFQSSPRPVVGLILGLFRPFLGLVLGAVLSCGALLGPNPCFMFWVCLGCQTILG